MSDEYDPQNQPLRIVPYYWACVARLASTYGVEPQSMLDTILGQAHHLPRAIGEEQMRRELRAQALVAQSLDDLDPREMYEEYVSALGTSGGNDALS